MLHSITFPKLQPPQLYMVISRERMDNKHQLWFHSKIQQWLTKLVWGNQWLSRLLLIKWFHLQHPQSIFKPSNPWPFLPNIFKVHLKPKEQLFITKTELKQELIRFSTPFRLQASKFVWCHLTSKLILRLKLQQPFISRQLCSIILQPKLSILLMVMTLMLSKISRLNNISNNNNR